MPATPKHSVSVSGIVVREDGRVLVIKRDDNGHWEAPGGVLELDESFEAGVQREVLEETGLEVIIERLTGVYKNLTRGIVALVYRCRPTGGEAHATEEAREICWMTIEEVQSAMVPAFSVRVSDAFEEAPSSRVHDGVSLI